jgi:ribonuclease P protein component
MFKKNNRLSKSKDIETVFRAGRSFFSPYFVVRFLPHNKTGQRIAVVVSTKTSKKAVERNRIKRIIREAAKPWLLRLSPGDYAIIAKGSAAKQPATVLRAGLNQLMDRLANSKSRNH